MDCIKTGTFSNASVTPLMDEVKQLRQRIAELETIEADLVRTTKALRESEERYRILLDESSDPIFAFYPDGQYRYVNKAFADGVSKKREDIIGRKIWDVFPRDEADKRYATVKWVFENADTKVIEVRVPRTDGDRYYLTTAKPILDEQGKVMTVICISKEITERKRMEQDLQHLSTHDILTGLYNRNFFQTELARIQHGRLFPVSVLVVDMDNLKNVNDRYGHTAGDDLIRQLAQELRQVFRVEDIVARIGGDEFAVLLPQTDEPTAQAAVARLRANLENQPDTQLKISIGLATGGGASSLTDVMQQADDRMYLDKSSHKKIPVTPSDKVPRS